MDGLEITKKRESFPSETIKDEDRNLVWDEPIHKIHETDAPPATENLWQDEDAQGYGADEMTDATDNWDEYLDLAKTQPEYSKQQDFIEAQSCSGQSSSGRSRSCARRHLTNFAGTAIILCSLFAGALGYELINADTSIMNAESLKMRILCKESRTTNSKISRFADITKITILESDIRFARCPGNFDDDGVYVQIKVGNGTDTPISDLRFELAPEDGQEGAQKVQENEPPTSPEAEETESKFEAPLYEKTPHQNAVVNLKSGERYFNAKGYVGAGEEGYMSTIIHVAEDSPEKSEHVNVLRVTNAKHN